jgi:hypothetical protein
MSLQENVDDDHIRRYTGISQRAMRRLRKTYHETGEVVRVPVCPGRPRILDSLDADVSCISIIFVLVTKLSTSFWRVVLSASQI